MQQDLLQNQLSNEELQALRNKRTGMFVFQASWILAFISLVVVNWQLRFSANWAPEGTQKADPILAAIATGALILSVFLVNRALTAIQQDDVQAFLTQWASAIGLGAVFVVMTMYEWFSIPFATQYSQVFRLMTGFHVLHAVVIAGYMVYVYTNGHVYHAMNYWAVEAGAKLWYFVLIAWMLFYIVIYWV